MKTHFHKEALEAARSFLGNLPVDVQLNKYSQSRIEENRRIITSIVSCITFCGSHDLAVRGKHYGEGILEDLYQLRIDAGDVVLKKHIDHGKKNASYRSVDIQNEIISICGDVLKEDIIKEVKEAEAYSVLADETADISGTEQLSIGLRYFHEKNNEVQEVFVGFVELKGLDAKSIAQTIDEFLTKEKLIPVKCVGLGFDGCSTMSGKEGGVQAILRKKYTKALFFHCSSHKLNLVINDLNALPEIRNTIGTTKDIISFFRESILRRKLIPNISTLCETRWSEKHKTIRVFKDNFHVIMEALETLSRDGNSATRNHAFQLRVAASRVSFYLCLLLIAKYSVLMEPVVNVLQSVTLDAIKASQHIKNIVQLLKRHRDDADKVTDEILRDAFVIAKTLGLEEDMTSVPRIFGSQSYQSNHPARSPSEYWKRSLIISYLDSIINSLKGRFAKENTPSFALSKLHPAQMQTMSMESLTKACQTFSQFYDLPNIKYEIELWQQLWQDKPNVIELAVVDVLKETKTFFPETSKALKILITLPCTTCTVERSFSSLRRMKTWLRSTMVESRLNGLAMMSVHRKIINENIKSFNNKVVEKFTKNPRRLCFN
ncbi:52 kDa repressor of the inhibitor of the protein kinase-like [Centruroides vittatus]|uniref:52 kDa repressor of the inhibitor of the protein kinase-like n=1 Tax=Centruroides vittatus TaxID=120091 RepID=UPI00350EC01B